MELDFNKKEKIAGAFIIFVVILLLTTVIIIGRGKDWFKKNIIYYTTFDESYNLQVNAAVKLYNADIGKVKKITLVQDKVKVKLAILEDYASRIRSDSVAVVKSPTFIGSEYVSIIPGDPKSPPIPKGGEINSKAKRSVSDILDEFQVEKTAKMVIKAVQDFSEIAKKMRDPQGPLFSTIDNVNKTTSHIEKITHDVQAGKGIIGSMLKSEALLASFRDNIDRLGSILDNFAKASETTPETIKKIGEEVFDSVASIKRISKEVEKSLGKLKVILVNMEKGSYDIPEVMQSTKRGIQEIREGVENIDNVFQSLQKNFFIRQNLPTEPEVGNIDAGLRQ